MRGTVKSVVSRMLMRAGIDESDFGYDLTCLPDRNSPVGVMEVIADPVQAIRGFLSKRQCGASPYLDVVRAASVEVVEGRPHLLWEGGIYQIEPIAVMVQKACALDRIWTRQEVALLIERYMRSKVLTLSSQEKLCYMDYVVLVHAICAAATVSMGVSPKAAVARGELRKLFSRAVSADAACRRSQRLSRDGSSGSGDYDGSEGGTEYSATPSFSADAPAVEAKIIAGVGTSTIVGSVRADAVENWEPPVSMEEPEPCAGFEAAPAADVAQLREELTATEGTKEVLPEPCVCATVPDSRYGEDVPERELQPTVGKLRVKETSQRRFFRPTAHHRVLDLPVADTVVFYDRNYVPNAVAGFKHRIMRVVEPFRPDAKEYKALCLAADALGRFLRKAMDQRVSYIGQLSEVYRWLKTRNYPSARRKNLVKCLDREGFVVDGMLQAEPILKSSRVDCFIKNECYPRQGNKPPRLICARDDPSKMLLGPLFAPLDDALFNSRFSLKHLENEVRPSSLVERIGDGRVLVLDYTAYESSQRRPLQLAVEQRVYRSTICDESNRDFVEICLAHLVSHARVSWGRGVVDYHGPVLRFSGEVTTSLGNTINNIVAIMVARCVASGFDLDSIDWDQQVEGCPVIVEGDDSIQAIPDLPDDQAIAWCDRVCETLRHFGLVVKPEVHEHASEGGFCGLCWNRDTGHLQPRDIVNTLAKLCWTSSKIRAGDALSMKAMSAEDQYKHTPLLSALAHRCRKDSVAHGLVLDRYQVDELRLQGYEVWGEKQGYGVRLTKGVYEGPSDQDYEWFSRKTGLGAVQLKEVDANSLRGNFDPLRGALIRLLACKCD